MTESAAAPLVNAALRTGQTAGLPDYVTELLLAVLTFIEKNRDVVVARVADALGGLFRFVPRALRVRYVGLVIDTLAHVLRHTLDR